MTRRLAKLEKQLSRLEARRQKSVGKLELELARLDGEKEKLRLSREQYTAMVGPSPKGDAKRSLAHSARQTEKLTGKIAKLADRLATVRAKVDPPIHLLRGEIEVERNRPKPEPKRKGRKPRRLTAAARTLTFTFEDKPKTSAPKPAPRNPYPLTPPSDFPTAIDTSREAASRAAEDADYSIHDKDWIEAGKHIAKLEEALEELRILKADPALIQDLNANRTRLLGLMPKPSDSGPDPVTARVLAAQDLADEAETAIEEKAFTHARWRLDELQKTINALRGTAPAAAVARLESEHRRISDKHPAPKPVPPANAPAPSIARTREKFVYLLKDIEREIQNFARYPNLAHAEGFLRTAGEHLASLRQSGAPEDMVRETALELEAITRRVREQWEQVGAPAVRKHVEKEMAAFQSFAAKAEEQYRKRNHKKMQNALFDLLGTIPRAHSAGATPDQLATMQAEAKRLEKLADEIFVPDPTVSPAPSADGITTIKVDASKFPPPSDRDARLAELRRGIGADFEAAQKHLFEQGRSATVDFCLTRAEEKIAALRGIDAVPSIIDSLQRKLNQLRSEAREKREREEGPTVSRRDQAVRDARELIARGKAALEAKGLATANDLLKEAELKVAEARRLGLPDEEAHSLINQIGALVSTIGEIATRKRAEESRAKKPASSDLPVVTPLLKKVLEQYTSLVYQGNEAAKKYDRRKVGQASQSLFALVLRARDAGAVQSQLDIIKEQAERLHKLSEELETPAGAPPRLSEAEQKAWLSSPTVVLTQTQADLRDSATRALAELETRISNFGKDPDREKALQSLKQGQWYAKLLRDSHASLPIVESLEKRLKALEQKLEEEWELTGERVQRHKVAAILERVSQYVDQAQAALRVGNTTGAARLADLLLEVSEKAKEAGAESHVVADIRRKSDVITNALIRSPKLGPINDDYGRKGASLSDQIRGIANGLKVFGVRHAQLAVARARETVGEIEELIKQAKGAGESPARLDAMQKMLAAQLVELGKAEALMSRQPSAESDAEARKQRIHGHVASFHRLLGEATKMRDVGRVGAAEDRINDARKEIKSALAAGMDPAHEKLLLGDVEREEIENRRAWEKEKEAEKFEPIRDLLRQGGYAIRELKEVNARQYLEQARALIEKAGEAPGIETIRPIYAELERQVVKEEKNTERIRLEKAVSGTEVQLHDFERSLKKKASPATLEMEWKDIEATLASLKSRGVAPEKIAVLRARADRAHASWERSGKKAARVRTDLTTPTSGSVAERESFATALHAELRKAHEALEFGELVEAAHHVNVARAQQMQFEQRSDNRQRIEHGRAAIQRLTAEIEQAEREGMKRTPRDALSMHPDRITRDIELALLRAKSAFEESRMSHYDNALAVVRENLANLRKHAPDTDASKYDAELLRLSQLRASPPKKALEQVAQAAAEAPARMGGAPEEMRAWRDDLIGALEEGHRLVGQSDLMGAARAHTRASQWLEKLQSHGAPADLLHNLRTRLHQLAQAVDREEKAEQEIAKRQSAAGKTSRKKGPGSKPSQNPEEAAVREREGIASRIKEIIAQVRYSLEQRENLAPSRPLLDEAKLQLARLQKLEKSPRIETYSDVLQGLERSVNRVAPTTRSGAPAPAFDPALAVQSRLVSDAREQLDIAQGWIGKMATNPSAEIAASMALRSADTHLTALFKRGTPDNYVAPFKARYAELRSQYEAALAAKRKGTSTPEAGPRKDRTYKQAIQETLQHLGGLGWSLSSLTLKTPHATRNGLRLWFHPQSVYFFQSSTGSYGPGHTLAYDLDLRKLTPAEFLAVVERRVKRQSDAPSRTPATSVAGVAKPKDLVPAHAIEQHYPRQLALVRGAGDRAAQIRAAMRGAVAARNQGDNQDAVIFASIAWWTQENWEWSR
jgi:hypothetical protein